MKLHHLKPAEGSKKDRKRVGRGRSGVRGKTAGRGTKGTGARKNVPLGFEGGQMPLQRRVPKLKGFTNPNRVEYAVINVEMLAKVFSTSAAAWRLRKATAARSAASAGWSRLEYCLIFSIQSGLIASTPRSAPAMAPAIEAMVSASRPKLAP